MPARALAVMVVGVPLAFSSRNSAMAGMLLFALLRLPFVLLPRLPRPPLPLSLLPLRGASRTLGLRGGHGVQR